MAEDIKDTTERLAALGTQAKDIKDTTERLAALGTQAKELQDSIVDIKKEYASWGNQMLSTGTELLSQRQQLHAAEAAAREAEKAALLWEIETNKKLSDDEKQSIKNQIDLLDKKIKSEKESAKIAETQVELAKSTDSIFESIASRMLITRSATRVTAKNIGRALLHNVKWERSLKNAGQFAKNIASSIKTAATSFTDMFSLTNIATSAMSKIFQVTMEMLEKSSAAQANFAKATGMLNINIADGMDLASGVNYAEASQAAIGLTSSFRGFMDLQDPARRSLQRTAGRIERLGGSAQDLGKHVEFMGKALGVSAKDAERMFTGVVSSAQDLGLTAAEATATFREFSGQMALYGPRIGKKFREIAAGAKASGLEIAEVVSLGEQFDTFEGATRAVSQLNAYLGGPVFDSMEMFYLQTEKGPEAVQKHVVETLRAQGKSIETMSYSEQKAFAETLKMKVGGFQKLMGFQSKEAKAAEAKAKKEERRQERYNRVLGRTLSFMERIQIMFQSIFDNEDLREEIRLLVEGLGKFLRDNDGFVTDLALGMAKVVKYAAKFFGWIGQSENSVEKIAISLAGLKIGGMLLSAFLTRLAVGSAITAATGGAAATAGAGAALGGGLAAAAAPIAAAALVAAGAYGVYRIVDGAIDTGVAAHEAQTTKGDTISMLKKANIDMGPMTDERTGRYKPSPDFILNRKAKELQLKREAWVKERLKKQAGAKQKSPAPRGVPELRAAGAPTASLIPPAKKQTKKDEAKADDQAKGIGKQIATAFIEEMKKNSEPSKVEFKFTFDDIVGENSPVHDVLWKSINNSMVKKTA